LIAREVYLTARDGAYRKSPQEDRDSMREGIVGQKGRIHIEVGAQLSADAVPETGGKTEQAKAVASHLDREIQRNFKLWPSHHIALAMLEGEAGAPYTAEEKEAFTLRMEKRLDALKVQGQDRAGIRQSFLQLYAGPARNARHWQN
jgi:hypothetical protein